LIVAYLSFTYKLNLNSKPKYNSLLLKYHFLCYGGYGVNNSPNQGQFWVPGFPGCPGNQGFARVYFFPS